MTDIALTLNSENVYDITIADNGDLQSTDGLDTAILMSALCEKRADKSEIIEPKFRRGDWSNELNEVEGYEVGSKLWLLDNARINNQSIQRGTEEIEEGLQWLIDDNVVADINVTGEKISSRAIKYTVELKKEKDQVGTTLYEIFSDTRTV